MIAHPSRAYVLAGGHGSRMGADKARVPFFLENGDVVSMAVATALPLVALGLDVIIVRRTTRQNTPWLLPDGRELVEIVEPTEPTRHPLFGVSFALKHSGGDAVVVPCDVPWVSVESWRTLLSYDAPVIAESENGMHTLVGCFPYAWHDTLRAFARDGGRVRSAVSSAQRVRLPTNELRNVNVVEDLAANWADRVRSATVEQRAIWSAQGIVLPDEAKR